MNYQPLKYIYQPSGIPDAYTLLLLHGTVGDENDLLPFANHFGDGINILSLRGNVSEAGMPRFFRRLGMGVFDEKDLKFRTEEMVAFIKQIAEQEKFNVEKVIALGYSNGANIAGSALLLYPDFFAGAILYRPMQPYKVVDENIKNNNHTPIFMSNGQADPTIDPADTQKLIATLKDAGFDVTNHSLPIGHQLARHDIQLSVQWYNKNFK